MIRSLFVQLAGVLVSIPVYGGMITTQTFDFSNGNGVVQATVTVTVLDNYHGDTSKEDWIYTINNLSFTTTPAPNAPTAGLSAFGTPGGALATLTFYHVSDVTGVFVPGNNPPLMGDISPGFCYQCDLLGGGWAFNDVLPGQSATVDYSWLNVTGALTSAITADAYLGVISNYYFPSVEAFLSGDVLVPRSTLVPEPRTSGLIAFGLCIFASRRWR